MDTRRDLRNSRMHNMNSRTPKRPHERTNVDLSTVECYACHKFGHYASDPVCEKYNERTSRPRVTAMAIEVDDEDHERQGARSAQGSKTHSDRSRTSRSSSSTSSSSLSESRYESVHDLDRYERESHTLSYYSDSRSTSSSSLTSLVDYASSDSTHTVQLAQMSAEGLRLAPMTIDLTAQKVRLPYKGEGKDPNVYDSNIRRRGSSAQPERTPEAQRVMTALVMINGAPAWTMFDTGSTADCIAPEFARVHNCKVFDLESPVPLQLGTKGSKSTIVYGANVTIKSSPSLQTVEYMDIINIDRYDAILGTPYMSKHGIILDLRQRTISFADGSKIKALDTEDEAKYREGTNHQGPKTKMEQRPPNPEQTEAIVAPRDQSQARIQGLPQVVGEAKKAEKRGAPGTSHMATIGDASRVPKTRSSREN